MDASLPFLFAAMIGFAHAFEADHLVAVGNIVSKRKQLTLALKDGVFWGMGHTSTIILFGLIMIIGKATFLHGIFGYFEALVGLMLVIIGFFRMFMHFYRKTDLQENQFNRKNHYLAYCVGLIHGLAGSGVIILLVMAEIHSNWSSMIYLLIFGIGSIVGMFLAAGIFSLPFSKKMSANKSIQFFLIMASSVLCIGYGAYIMLENLQ